MIRQLKHLYVCHHPGRNKWPETSDTDFSSWEMLRTLYNDIYELNGERVRVITSAFPIYACYDTNGWKFPEQLNNPGDINNSFSPDPLVAARMIQLLSDLSEEYDIISWVHAAHCYPEVAKVVLPKFKLSVLHFGDDCPGSSETKSFPVVKYFDTVINRMLVWDYSTGEMVPDKYAEHGFRGRTYHNAGGFTTGVFEWIKEHGFDIEEKLARPELPIDLVWLGSISMGAARRALLHNMNIGAAHEGITTRLHGYRMRDGGYGAPPTSSYPGRDAAELYNEAATGLNYPVSSYFNGRLFDLPLLGVAPVMYDPHGELETVGMLPWEHYAPYDGTSDSLYKVVRDLLAKPTRRKRIARQANTLAHELYRTHGADSTFRKMLADHMGRF